MKITGFFKNRWLIAALVLASFVGIARVATVENGTNINNLVLDENKIYDSNGTLRVTLGAPNLISGGTVETSAIKFGNSTTAASVTLPTAATGASYSMQVPVYNASGGTIAAGSVLIASNTGTGYVNVAAASAVTNVVGVAAASIASGAVGYMVPRGGGYTVVLATGAIAIGDVLVSSVTSANAGINNTPTTGTDFAIALSSKATGSSALILAIMQ